jgi:hypothetical protein
MGDECRVAGAKGVIKVPEDYALRSARGHICYDILISSTSKSSNERQN